MINPKAILLSVALAVLAYVAAPVIPGMNSIIIGLFLGIIAGNLITFKKEVSTGISFISSKGLEFAILFIAFSIDYGKLKDAGSQVVLLIAVMILAVLILGFLLGKLLKTKSSSAWLVSFGTAICGSSAIAALAPSVSDDQEEVGVSIAVVNLLGTLGMIVMAFVMPLLPWYQNAVALFIGSSLHSLGNVAGAGYAISEGVGEMAVAFKLTRIAFLTPALIIINLLINRKKGLDLKSSIKLPWYLIGFILISIVASVVEIPTQALGAFSVTSKILLTIAMVAIGLKISFATLFSSGKKGLAFGSLLFAGQLAILLLLFWLFI